MAYQKTRIVQIASTEGNTSNDDRNNVRARWSFGSMRNATDALIIGVALATAKIEAITGLTQPPPGRIHNHTEQPIKTSDPTTLCQPALRPDGSTVVVMWNPASAY